MPKRQRDPLNTSVSKKGFQRLVKEISTQLRPDLRWESVALQALQEATEAYMAQFFERANGCARLARRRSVTVRDLKLIQRFKLN